MTKKATDQLQWDISDFYKRSWNLIKENKKILIFGVAVAVFAGSGSNSNNFRSSDSENDLSSKDYGIEETTGLEKFQEFYQDETTEYKLDEPEKAIEKIASKPYEKIGAVFLDGFKNVNPGIYAVLGLQFILVTIFVIVFSIAAASWAQGALIKAISEAETKKSWKIFSVAKNTWPRVGSLVWINIVPWLLFYFAVVGLLIMYILGFAVLEGRVIAPFFGIIAGIVGIVALFYYSFRIAYSQLFAKRYSIIDDLSGKDAWKKGWSLSNGNLLKMVRLTILNSLLSLGAVIAIIIPIAVIALIVYTPLFNNVSLESILAGESYSIIAVISLFSSILFFITIVVFGIFSAFWQTFVFGVHHYAYQSLRNKLEEVSEDA